MPVPGVVKAGQEVEIKLDMQAPSLPGKYCAFFRFVYADNQRFGQKVWCDILAEEDPQVFEQIAKNIQLSEPKQMEISQPDF